MIDKNLGHVTAYAYAVEKGYTGTEEEFAELMASYATVAESAAESAEQARESAVQAGQYSNASRGYSEQAGESATSASGSATSAGASKLDSEAYAVGKRNGVDVGSGDVAYHNNAKYYAEQASGSATSAESAKDTAVSSKDTAVAKAGEASTSAQTATNKANEASTSETNASAHKLVSEGYAVGKQNGQDVGSDSPYYENNAKYYAEQAEETLEDYAKVDGYYDEMTVGTAEQLISSATIEDDELYVFRSAGGTNDIGNRETDMLVGGTVAWNQLAKAVGTHTTNDVTLTKNSDGTVTLNGTASASGSLSSHDAIPTKQGHKYLIHQTSAVSIYCVMCDPPYISPLPTVIEGKTNANCACTARASQGTVFDNVKLDLMVIDLTAMFGTEIADYIYGLEQANAGAGVAWFRQYFPKPYYTYNAGSLQSVNVASHDMTGFNQWDEEWELGFYNTTNGTPTSSSTYLRSKSTNYIDVIGGADYYFCSESNISIVMLWYDADKNYISYQSARNVVVTAPSNAIYGRFYLGSDSYGTTYKNDICINRVWTGYRNGEYEEYVKHSYPYDETVELRGIPQLVDGKLTYDGDTYESSGKVTRKYGVFEITNSTNIQVTSNYSNITYAKISKPNDALDKGKATTKCIHTSYTISTSTSNWDDASKVGYLFGGADTANYWFGFPYGTTQPQMQSKLAGTQIVYELATPTEETADPFTNPQICDDFGTEEYVDAGVKNGTRDVAIPVGHVTQYMANLRDKLQHLPSLAPSDGDYIIGQSGTSMSLKPIAPYFNAEHPNLTAGSANQLLSTITIEDQTPYTFRTSGGSVDIGDRETDMIVGGTIAWNQLAPIASSSRSTTKNEITITDNRDGSYTVNGTATAYTTYAIVSERSWRANHIYIFWGCPPNGSESTYSLRMLGAGGDTAEYGNGALWNPGTTTWKGIAVVVRNGVTVNNLVFRPNIVDLTQMFGHTIANYILSLETANAGAGVSFFRKLFPKPYYEYNAGELLSVSGLQSHDMRGFNAWDEEWEFGGVNVDTGETTTLTDRIRSKNLFRVMPNTGYYFGSTFASNFYIQILMFDANQTYLGRADGYVAKYKNQSFTTAPNCHYIRFGVDQSYGTTYKHDICINLSWDGERDGEYEPYTINSYALDDSLTLRGIPKLDASNNLYYDGDTYESDGTVTRKYGIVDLGTLDWLTDPNRVSVFRATITGKRAGQSSADRKSENGVFCGKYVYINEAVDTSKDKYISDYPSYGAYQIFVRDTAYTDATAFKTAMSGVYLVYQLATPTEESAEPYTNPQIVDDFGTEEYVTDSIVPVGHVTQYQPNLRAKLEMAPNSPDGDGDYVVKQTNGENEYVTLASTTTIQSILARLEALEGGN